MSIRKILSYPEKSLMEKSVQVGDIDDNIRELIRDMGETMFESQGVGLAAPQIGVNKRIIVYDLNAGKSEDDGSENEFRALINPEITDAKGSVVSEKEACLSVPDYRADVKRYANVSVKALDIDGNPVELKADGIHAIIFQHEIDHLDGILYIHRISVLKRSLYKKRIQKKLKKTKQS